MAHFAQINQSNIVLQVIVVSDANCLDDQFQESESDGVAFCQTLFGEDTMWKQTSYNNNIRKNFAAIGYTYDEQKDAFIAPKPYDSWLLNETTCRWESPISYPDDGSVYRWDEATTSWVLIT